MHKKVLGYALIYAVLSSILASAYPVLDEESYRYIAQSMSFSRPYDWILPWPPYTDSYRYAHPPLFLYWMMCVQYFFGASIFWTKLILGIPFRFILGYSAGLLLIRYTPDPKQNWSLVAWLCSPIVIMVGARSMMPDLMCSALGTASMALYLSSNQEERAKRILCGVLLGLSCWVKYPALLLWVPIFFSYRTWKGMWPIIVGFLCTWGLGEGWLWSVYGQSHLAVVLSTADHVSRGSLAGRVVGFVMRLMIGMPFLYVLCRRRYWIWLLVLLPLSWWCIPTLSMMGTGIAMIWISCSVLGLALCLRRLDFFSVWWITIFVGVCITHNFASPRYLILGMVPLVILVMREIVHHHILRYPILAGTLILSLCIAHYEHLHAQETWKLVQNLETGLHYSGEWTFRWGMRNKGGMLWKGESVPVIQPNQAVGGVVPQGFARIESYMGGEYRRLLLDRSHSVGYYSETLGFWPLGFHKGPIEELYLWKP